jgi:hypothetical protein
VGVPTRPIYHLILWRTEFYGDVIAHPYGNAFSGGANAVQRQVLKFYLGLRGKGTNQRLK